MPRSQYIVTTDGRQALLYRCQSDRPGRCSLERLRELRNTHADTREHHRPTMLGSGPTANAHHLASPNHDREEDQRRFARDIAQWLNSAGDGAPDSELTLFAPPALLGHLRQEKSIPARCVLKKGELAHLRPSDLAEHPEIVACTLDRPPGRAA
jgi:protein required for attachment to host cells